MNTIVSLGLVLTSIVLLFINKNLFLFQLVDVPFKHKVNRYSKTNRYIYFADANEKTEQPTQKKLQDAKKKGNVTKSVDLTGAIILIIILVLMAAVGDKGVRSIYDFVTLIIGEFTNIQLTEDNVIQLYTMSLLFFFKTTGLTFVVVMIAGVIANVAQTGFIRSTDPLKPDFKKLNVIKGIKNMFSKKALFNLFKTLLKFIFIGVIAYNFVKAHIGDIFSMTGLNIAAIYPFIKDLIFSLLIQVAAIMLVLGIIDFVFQKYDYKKQLKMTKQEVKEEYKQMEGNPEIKSQRKQKQKQLSMNRMMSAVSDSTVVVTNPTHFAIAIKYKNDEDEVPLVVAKGADYIAAKIREKAKEEKVPIIENRYLARLLYKKVEIGQAIPGDLFQAVAEILAVVYKMKRKYN